MTLLFMDGFDRYGALSEVTRNYEVVGLSGTSLLTTGGAFGGGAIEFTRSVEMQKAIIGNPQTCIVSFRIFRQVPSNDGDFFFIDTNAAGGGLVLESRDGTSTVAVLRGSGGSLLGTFTLPVQTWQWVSIKYKASDTVGTIDIQVQGSTVFTFPAGDTVKSGTETCNLVRFGGSNIGSEIYDDVFITDVAGGAPFNDLLGDMRIETLLPDAVGDNADFTATPAVANYLNVDDVAPDDDTTYVESSTLADKDLHNLGALAITPGVIEAVNVFALARNPLGGGASLKLLAKENLTEGAGAVQSLGSGYSYINELFLVNPDTSAKWTETEVNAMQAGYENA